LVLLHLDGSVLGLERVIYIFEERKKVRRLILFEEFVLTAHKGS
jgi:hypothetical protein